MNLPKNILNLSNIFQKNKHEIYLVGGALRDHICGIKQYDYDFTTDATPQEVMQMFKKTIPVGVEHGTVLVLFENAEFEITTFRTEGKYSDNRHPDKVEFVRSIEEDLKRRDFTMNAIAYNITTKETIDLFNGIQDIEQKTIRAIGIADERFREDALRMIRACRFASKLGFNIESNTVQAIKNNCHLITSISMERIRDELIKILKTDKPSIGLEYLRTTGLMEFILPDLLAGYGITQNKFHAYDVYYHNVYSCDAAPKDNLKVRLAALFHDIAKPQTSRDKPDDEGNSFYNHEVIGSKIVGRIMKKLKFSKDETDSVKHLIRHHMFYYTQEWTDGAVRRFLRNVGIENLPDLFALREADREGNGKKQGSPKTFLDFQKKIKEIIEADNALKVTDLAIDGSQIMELLQIQPGRIIGEILNYLLELVLDNPELNNYETLSKKTVEYINEKEKNENSNN